MILTPASTADWAAIWIAVLALAVTIYEGFLARRHARISTRPILKSVVNLVPADSKRFNLELRNVGVGPAKLRRVTVWIDGQQCADNIQGWQNAVQRLSLPIDVTAYGYPEPGVTLEVGGVIELLGCPSESLHLVPMSQAIARIKVMTKYESLFGERFEETFNGQPLAVILPLKMSGTAKC